MKRKIFYILIFFLILFSHTSKVSAISCAQLECKVTDYNYYNKLQEDVCKDLSTSENTIMCNNSRLEKNLIVADLMKYKEENEICDTLQEDVDKIIKENKDNCSRILDENFSNSVNGIMTIFYIIAPILLIVFGSIDYARATAEGSEKGLRKANKNFIRRLIATILLFLAPAMTNIIISLNVSDYYLSGNAYSCNYNFTVFNDIRSIGMVQIKRQKGAQFTSFTPVKGGIVSDNQASALTEQLNSVLNTKEHQGNSAMQSGPFPKWWSHPYNLLSRFQCTWWANGRASQYLETNGTKYKKYPTQLGDGGQYYEINIEEGYFKYGNSPRPNSIISWSKGSGAGHVAYVEGVSDDAIYISHAGSGQSWFGVDKISLDGSLTPLGWSGYSLNGYIYLDEPL